MRASGSTCLALPAAPIPAAPPPTTTIRGGILPPGVGGSASRVYDDERAVAYTTRRMLTVKLGWRPPGHARRPAPLARARAGMDGAHADDATPAKRDDLGQIVQSIGPKIRRLRQLKGLSLQQLGERSDISAAAIHKIERNGMVPTITTLMKLAVALNRP